MLGNCIWKYLLKGLREQRRWTIMDKDKKKKKRRKGKKKRF